MQRDHFRETVVWVSFVLTILVILAHSLNAELFLGATGAIGTTEVIEAAGETGTTEVTETAGKIGTTEVTGATGAVGITEATEITEATGTVEADGTAVGRIEALVSGSIAQIAVPGFFMISSLLFFQNYELSKTVEKWRRRVRTLLIPYLLWNGIYYLGYVLASRVPGLSRVVGKGIIPFTPQELLHALLLYTYNYGFWYIFQLLLLTALSPLIYAVAKRTLIWGLTSFLLCVVIALRLDPTPLNADALFYYLTAARIALCAGRRNVLRGGIRTGLALVAAAVTLNFFADATGNDLPRVLCRMSGAVAIWILCAGAGLPEPRSIMKQTFLIYAIHFAPVRLITKAADVIFHGNAALALGLYFLMPILILMIAQGTVVVGRRYCPGVLALFTGGR